MNIKSKNIILFATVILFAITGVFHAFIANEKPLICEQNGEILFPVFSEKFRSEEEFKAIINPLIRYSYHTIDMKNTGAVSPFGFQDLQQGQQRHFLGTDIYGRDVLAGMIYGSSIALWVGIGSMLLALIIGMLMSLFPAYYGDSDMKISIKLLVLLLVGLGFSIYLATYFNYFVGSFFFGDFLALLLVVMAIIALFYKFPYLKKNISVPLDSSVGVFISIFQSMPSAFLILILISLFAKASLLNIILVIGFLKWPVIARYIRAEVLRVKKERFVEASKVLGIDDSVIVFRHIFPYTLTPVVVALSYGFAGTVLLESTLAFLGIGIPADHVSWGTLLGEARQNISAWWLAVFPGLAIFIVTYIFNGIGEKYSRRFR